MIMSIGILKKIAADQEYCIFFAQMTLSDFDSLIGDAGITAH